MTRAAHRRGGDVLRRARRAVQPRGVGAPRRDATAAASRSASARCPRGRSSRRATSSSTSSSPRRTRRSSGSSPGSRRCSSASGTRRRSRRARYYCKRVILESLIETSDDPIGEIGFKLHDFGSRGVSSRESARIGGAAHLVNFLGSDTVEGVRAANHYYGTADGMAGYSIPAAEHSTITMWGRENEAHAYRELRPEVPRRTASSRRDAQDCRLRLGQLRPLQRHRERLVRRAPRHHQELRRQARRPARLRAIPAERQPPVPADHGPQDRDADELEGVQGAPPVPRPHPGRRHQRRVDRRDPSRAPLAQVLRVEHRRSGWAAGSSSSSIATRSGSRSSALPRSAGASGSTFRRTPRPTPGSGARRGTLLSCARGASYSTVRGPRKDDLLVPVYENGRVLRTYTLDEVRADRHAGPLVSRGAGLWDAMILEAAAFATARFALFVVATGAGADIQEVLWRALPGCSSYLAGASFPYAAERREDSSAFGRRGSSRGTRRGSRTARPSSARWTSSARPEAVGLGLTASSPRSTSTAATTASTWRA